MKIAQRRHMRAIALNYIAYCELVFQHRPFWFEN